MFKSSCVVEGIEGAGDICPKGFVCTEDFKHQLDMERKACGKNCEGEGS
jgi:hypothetical protein